MRNIYSKPVELSDPFHEWGLGGEWLVAIVAKPKETLTLADYNIIFYKILPAATYEEGAYYIDGCFDLMRRKDDAYETNICPGLFYFINYHRKELAKDHLLEPCLEATADLLRHYTNDFELVRKGDNETGFHVIDQSLPEMVRYESSVADLLDELVEYRLYEPLVQSFLSWLNEDIAHLTWLNGDIVYQSRRWKSCWWVYISHHTKDWYTTPEFDHPSTTWRKQRIINKLMDLRVFPKHYWRHLCHARESGFGRYLERVSF